MFVILGASGHVGTELVKALRAAGQPVLAVVHDAEKATGLSGAGVEVVVVDLRDGTALNPVFRHGTRAFLLNPPGDPTGDANMQELATARSITGALADSGLEKIVVASTYGAQPGEAVGDLSTLHEFEQLAVASGIPAAINRGAYYFSNLDILAEPAREGTLPTGFPEDFLLPMVDASDLAAAAAERLQSGIDDVGVRYVEGPERHTFGDVARSFARHLGRQVAVVTTPREGLADSYRQVGFSGVSALSFARMTEATLDGPELPEHPWRGKMALDAYVARLLQK